MINKISIGFLGSDSNAELVVKVDTITSALTGNPNYPATDSGIAEVIALNTEFKDAIVAAADGGTALTAARNAKRSELCMRVRTLAAYVQANGKNDQAILISSGFPMQKSTRTPSTILPAPVLQSIGAGPNTGTVVMKLVALGAQVYNWRCFLASDPQTNLSVMQSTSATTLFTGLTPGQSYCFQGNATNAAGTSDWSAPVPLIVT
ncbi:MAG: fibronectin type III domain-containing protein [Chthoniobacterales bacterium]